MASLIGWWPVPGTFQRTRGRRPERRIRRDHERLRREVAGERSGRPARPAVVPPADQEDRLELRDDGALDPAHHVVEALVVVVVLDAAAADVADPAIDDDHLAMVEMEQVLGVRVEAAAAELAGANDDDPVVGDDLDAGLAQVGGRASLLPKSTSLPMASTARRTSTPLATLAASAVEERRRRCRPPCSRRSAGGRGPSRRRCPRGSAGSSGGRGAAGRPRSRSPARTSGRGRRAGHAVGRPSRSSARPRSRHGSRSGRTGRSGPVPSAGEGRLRSRRPRHRWRSSVRRLIGGPSCWTSMCVMR